MKAEEFLNLISYYAKKYPDAEFITQDGSVVQKNIECWFGKIEGDKFVDVEEKPTAILIY